MTDSTGRRKASRSSAKHVERDVTLHEQTDRFRNGMAFRRLIHGGQHVDDAWEQARQSPQRAALEEFITESVWGMIWSRSGLPIKSRSLITMALLIATNRPGDLRLHMRSAVLRNECSIDELREVVLHTAAYCGVPAAVDAFALTDKLASELQLGGTPDAH